MPGFALDLMEQYNYDALFLCQEKNLGLKAIFAIHDTMEKVLALAKAQGVPAYRAANLLAEQRLAMARQVKSLATIGVRV
jgi:hypothetical protein